MQLLLIIIKELINYPFFSVRIAKIISFFERCSIKKKERSNLLFLLRIRIAKENIDIYLKFYKKLKIIYKKYFIKNK